jgi:hypothetical protein
MWRNDLNRLSMVVCRGSGTLQGFEPFPFVVKFFLASRELEMPEGARRDVRCDLNNVHCFSLSF